jgi:hypothetical protein
MGRRTLTDDDFRTVHTSATRGGTRSATQDAEERLEQGFGLDPLVDPKGLPHLGVGPTRMSLPRFEQQPNGLWLLTQGLPMAEETLLDTTGSMGNNVDLAFQALPLAYQMLTTGRTPVLDRYDPQITTAIFGDIVDKTVYGRPVLARSQFEMAEKIAQQMTMLIPSKGGGGNGKEDPQFGLFAAAYFTAASINRWGLKYYHFTISDEPVYPRLDLKWLEQIFGDDVLEWAEKNGYDFRARHRHLPDTEQVVHDLQKQAHAFFLQVNSRRDVTDQWTELYGEDHFVMLPGTTEHLHYVKAVIIGLTEGVLDLCSAEEFLQEHELNSRDAERIIRAVSHIPLGAQTEAENFDKIPVAGDLFREKTDLWPVDPGEVQDTGAPDSEAPDGPAWL